AEILHEIVDEHGKVFRIDLRAIRNHRGDETFPAGFIEFESHDAVQSVAGRAGGLNDLLSVAFRELRVLDCCESHRCHREGCPDPHRSSSKNPFHTILLICIMTKISASI